MSFQTMNTMKAYDVSFYFMQHHSYQKHFQAGLKFVKVIWKILEWPLGGIELVWLNQ